MVNLIPQKAKRRLLIEYWVRAVSVWFTTWAVVLLAGVGILLPAYVLIGLQVDTLQTSASVASEKVANYESVSAALAQATRQAKTIIDESSSPQFSEYITLFSSLQGSGVEVTKMGIYRGAEGVAPVVLNGKATDRQSLASFRDRLLAAEDIVSVDLPISNLAQDKDISFTITVTLHNKNVL